MLFVTLAATAETRHIVDASVLDALGPDGLLVNISRAQNVDAAALLKALEQGNLRGAALDVFEGEPTLDPRFTRLDNVLLQGARVLLRSWQLICQISLSAWRAPAGRMR